MKAQKGLYSLTWCKCSRITELRFLTIFMIQRDRVLTSEHVSLNKPSVLRLVFGECIRPFNSGLNRSLRDQAQVAFHLSDLSFRVEYCKTEQGSGLLTISVRQ